MTFFGLVKEVFAEECKEDALKQYLQENVRLQEKMMQLVNVLTTAKSASVAVIQRCMKIGYALASGIIDGLESIGVVTPFNGIDSRTIDLEKLQKLAELLQA